jgi:hypothetical protein
MHAIAKVNCRHQNARKWSFHPNKKLKSHETMKLILCFMLFKNIRLLVDDFFNFLFSKEAFRLCGNISFLAGSVQKLWIFFLENFKFPTVSRQNSNFENLKKIHNFWTIPRDLFFGFRPLCIDLLF